MICSIIVVVTIAMAVVVVVVVVVVISSQRKPVKFGKHVQKKPPIIVSEHKPPLK
ncbi:unnamed protein product, partial [Rotaria magnacalcarata]